MASLSGEFPKKQFHVALMKYNSHDKLLRHVGKSINSDIVPSAKNARLNRVGYRVHLYSFHFNPPSND